MRSNGIARVHAVVLGSLLSACVSGPPPDFAPEPALVARMQSIEMVPAGGAVCPGRQVGMEYYAVMDDGGRIPFEARYDSDDPPALHVVMLNRSSRDATLQRNGSWRVHRDPLRTAMQGFTLNASLKVDPGVTASVVLAPEYSCVERSFAFNGDKGAEGQSGGSGLDVVVRLDIIRSPFVARLLVASIEVEPDRPFHLFFDADRVSSADWLQLASRGGQGGKGSKGASGLEGAPGNPGCPGGTGAPGGAGGEGGPGGTGGRGGRVTIIVPEENPFLAGLVDAIVQGGSGGAGGRGGSGGNGGRAGEINTTQRRCAVGERGPKGRRGNEGTQGGDGPRGKVEVIKVPRARVFGATMAPELAELVAYAADR